MQSDCMHPERHQTTKRIRIGFKGKNQLPLIMVWREWVDYRDRVVYAEVIWSWG